MQAALVGMVCTMPVGNSGRGDMMQDMSDAMVLDTQPLSGSKRIAIEWRREQVPILY